MPAFVGLMPVSSGDLIRGKIIASAIHLAVMWGVLLVLALGWALIGGHLGGMADRLCEVSGSPALAWLTLLAALAVVYSITYAMHFGSMWLGLFGSPAFAAVPVFAGLLLAILVAWTWTHWQPGYEPALRAGLWFVLATKLLLAAYLVRHDLTRHRVNAALLAVSLLAWATLTAALAGLTALLVGDTAALAVVVLSPLASCLAMPAILHRSRHGAWA